MIEISNFIADYDLFVQKRDDIFEISIVQKRGLYKCEDDIFYIKKNDSSANIFEFWDVMGYIKYKNDTIKNILLTLVRAIKKIDKMHEILQLYRQYKPILINSKNLSFVSDLFKNDIFCYDNKTKQITTINNQNYEYL